MQTYFQIGAGGTGTHFLPSLLTFTRSLHKRGEYQIVVADGDIFEEKNLARQLFMDGLVTVNKAEAMVTMYPGHPLIAVSRYIGKADIESMIQDGDIVLICADNFSVRRLVADHCQTLDNVTVINAGNEVYDGSVQLWVRRDGENKTPNIRYGHPEIAFVSEQDRSAMTCAQAAALPGGEQLILANQAAAHHMLTALWRLHTGSYETGWTELQFDLLAGSVEHIDMRERMKWSMNPA